MQVHIRKSVSTMGLVFVVGASIAGCGAGTEDGPAETERPEGAEPVAAPTGSPKVLVERRNAEDELPAIPPVTALRAEEPDTSNIELRCYRTIWECRIVSKVGALQRNIDGYSLSALPGTFSPTPSSTYATDGWRSIKDAIIRSAPMGNNIIQNTIGSGAANFVEIANPSSRVLGELIPTGAPTQWQANDSVSIGFPFVKDASTETRVLHPQTKFHYTTASDGVNPGKFYKANIVVLNAPSATSVSWALNGSEDALYWGNWNYGNAPTTNAYTVFLNDILTSPSTLIINSDWTMKNLFIDSPNAYVIAGTGWITLASNTGGSASIGIIAGSHQFQAKTKLLNNVSLIVGTTGTLTLNNTLNLNGKTLTKAGPGHLAINNQILAGSPPGSIIVQDGTCTGCP